MIMSFSFFVSCRLFVNFDPESLKRNVMRIKSEYKLREVAGETIIVNQGTIGVDMTRIISLNSSAKLLFHELSEKDFELADVAQVLMDNYGITQEKASTDAAKWVDEMKNCTIVG